LQIQSTVGENPAYLQFNDARSRGFQYLCSLTFFPPLILMLKEASKIHMSCFAQEKKIVNETSTPSHPSNHFQADMSSRIICFA